MTVRILIDGQFRLELHAAAVSHTGGNFSPLLCWTLLAVAVEVA